MAVCFGCSLKLISENCVYKTKPDPAEVHLGRNRILRDRRSREVIHRRTLVGISSALPRASRAVPQDTHLLSFLGTNSRSSSSAG